MHFLGLSLVNSSSRSTHVQCYWTNCNIRGSTSFHGNRCVRSHCGQAPIHKEIIMITAFAQHKCSIFFSLITVKGASITWQLFHPATPFCCSAYQHINCHHAPNCWRYVVNSSQKHSPPPSDQRHQIFQPVSLSIRLLNLWKWVHKYFTLGMHRGRPMCVESGHW